LFFRFIETFEKNGFKEIDENHPLMRSLGELTERNNQFFFIVDLIQVKILFTSKRSVEMIGIESDLVTPYHFFEATHPDDIQRHNLARSRMFGFSQEFFIEQKGQTLMSGNLRIRNPLGNYSNLLFQCFLFYSKKPFNTVYSFQLHTDIDWYKKIKHGYHYYVGNDMTKFRYPDDELLNIGNIFSDREFEIIKLIHSGLDSYQIADKLFLSKHTIDTHRGNILRKSGKKQISELIYDLQFVGLL
jgi:hypothetical protein